MNLKALLFDTRSIQRYIFSSNRLKANIGASYLVDQVFDDDLLAVLRKIGVDETTWKTETSPNWTTMNEKSRIAYIGGGNALVLFREDVTDKEIDDVVTEFTTRLLQSHPGLHTGAAIGTLRIDENGAYLDAEDEENGLSKLVHKLKAYQNSVFPEVSLPYTGLTQVCPETGETADALHQGHFCSGEFKAKLDAEDDAEKALVEKIRKVLPEEDKPLLDRFAFPTELEKLGQKETESYIAIVHIDGNNMGEKFAGMKTLTDRKELSLRLARKTTTAFADMLCEAVKEYDTYAAFLDLGSDRDKKLLPVRPLVLGGDDMAFICTAKLALRYTRRVMESMQKEAVNEESIDTCAGIAIQPASYPFFRGYMLAEQACDAAKKEMRKLRENNKAEKSCWLDFIIRHGEQAPSLSEIRKQEYRTREGYDMHFGPYRVDTTEQDEMALSNLETALNILKRKDYANRRLAMNKIKQLRDIIRHGAHEWVKFRQRLDERQDSLPNIDAWKDYAETLWKNNRTPYIDLIEMLDFYEPEGGEKHGAK